MAKTKSQTGRTEQTEKSLKDFLLESREKGPNERMGLRGSIIRDNGPWVTVKTPEGVVGERSKWKGTNYIVLDLVDRAPWDPNQLRATLKIQYVKDESRQEVYTYLDERFSDTVRFQF
jgi:hypothetical protein